MKKLFKLSILTITVLCANYGSIFAQDEQKAFKEGDKVLSVGISGGRSSSGYSSLTPTVSFDYGLKGTRGIVSIGGFLSYSNSTTQIASTFGSIQTYNPLDTSTYYSSFTNLNRQSITAGLRIGLHYSTRKWDLYAGAMVGYQFDISKNYQVITSSFKKDLNSQYSVVNSTSSTFSRSPTFNPNNIIISPYAGARYYLTPKISINLEVGQHTSNIGISFKF